MEGSITMENTSIQVAGNEIANILNEVRVSPIVSNDL